MVSPLGWEPGKFRLINHQSFSKDALVNDAIDTESCAVSYTSFNAALLWVRRYGQGVLLAKTDIEAAFRLLPVQPQGFHLLGCRLLD